MKILALDCSGSTGWAFGDGSFMESGVQRFKLERGSSVGMRFVKFRAWLQRMLEDLKPDLIVYEQAHHRGRAATELAVGMATRIHEEAELRHIEYTDIHTSTLKKEATGSGRASKREMIDAARKRWAIEPETDDEADAAMILAWALEEFGARRKEACA